MKKLVRKSIAVFGMFVGIAAVSALDSDIPMWGTLILIALFFIGLFGGGYLYCKGEPTPQID